MNLRKFNIYFYLIVTLTLLSLGFFLRIYNLEKVYSTYDDVWPFSLHKGMEGGKSFQIHNSFNFKLNETEIHNFENNIAFPLYIFSKSTYSPGQYLSYPFIFNENDSLNEFKFKGRVVSFFFSICSMILLIYFLLYINLKLNFIYLFILSLFFFSNNEIMNSHHASPYSCYTFFTLLGIFLLYIQIDKKLSFVSFLILNSIMCYFSYLNILFFIPSLYILTTDKNNSFLLYLFDLKKLKFYFISFFLMLPILFFAFINTSSISFHNELFEPLFYNNQNNFIISDFIKIFSIINYLFNGLLNSNLIYFNFVLLSLVFILLIYKLYYSKFSHLHKIFLISVGLVLFQYLIFYYLNKLPLLPTRHSSFFLPILIIIFYLIFNKVKLINFISSVFFIIFSIFSFYPNLNKLNQLDTLFNYDIIHNFDFDKIFVFGETLDPVLKFKEHKIYNLDLNSVSNNLNLDNNDNYILLISQHYKLEEWMQSKLFNNVILNQLKSYQVITKIEKSNEYRISVIDQENGYYLYYMQRL